MKKSIEILLTGNDFDPILEALVGMGHVFLPDLSTGRNRGMLYDRMDDILSEHEVFFSLSKQWIIGDLKYNRIDGGYRKGKYSLQPRVNFSGIEVYVHVGRKVGHTARASSCLLTLRDRPIDGETYEEHPSNEECVEHFKTAVKALRKTRRLIRFNSDAYLAEPEIIESLGEGRLLPPFDYQDRTIPEVR